MTREDSNIDDVMSSKGIKTDKTLAEMIGISTPSMSQRLNGNISMNTVELIAKTLDVSTEEIMFKKSKFKNK